VVPFVRGEVRKEGPLRAMRRGARKPDRLTEEEKEVAVAHQLPGKKGNQAGFNRLGFRIDEVSARARRHRGSLEKVVWVRGAWGLIIRREREEKNPGARADSEWSG